jgi:diguanylate cyclase (GGDEF)-like protein
MAVGGTCQCSTDSVPASGEVAPLTGRAQTVLEMTSDGVFFLDRDWRFSYLNAAAERLFDRGPGELLGLGVWDEFPEAVGSRSDIEYRAALRTGTPATFDDYSAPLGTTFEVRAFPDGNGLAVFFRDVHEDRMVRTQQESHTQLTRAILDSLPAHTAVLDRNGTITSTNQPWDAFGAQAGGDCARWSAGVNYLEVCRRAASIGDTDAGAVLGGLNDVANGAKDSFTLDYECSSPVTERWFALHAVPLLRHEGLIISHTDITARVLSQRRLTYQAYHDELTGLPNRRRLLQHLRHATEEADGSPEVAALLVDLDGFKNVNDSLGHDVGDSLLKQVAARLSATVDGADVVGRLGGDEFVVVAHDCDADAATELADEIRRTLVEPFDVAGLHLPMAASIGIAVNSSGTARPEDLLRDSGVARYAAKKGGRDRSQIFSAALGAAAQDRLELAAGLRLAVARDQLVLDYQPILTLADGVVSEVEALMRWNHPQRGLLSPGAFIALAEETGTIVPISRWLLAETLRQVRAWSADGISVAVAVNIAAQHLSVGSLLDDVTEALLVAGVPSSQLIIELTESDVARDLDVAATQLAALRELGVRIAIDDFGSGYSSLGQLATLPVDIIKIDRSLVNNLGATTSTVTTGAAGTEVSAATARTIITAVTAIAGSLGTTTIAEGIETTAQHEAAVELGCSHAQGFLFGRPMPADDLRAWLPATGVASPAT